MAIYGAQNVGGPIGQPLDERSWISVDMQTGADPTYNPNIEIIATPFSGINLTLDPVYTLHIYEASHTQSGNSSFYKEPHFLQDTIIVDGDAVDLGIITQDTSVFFEFFNSAGSVRTVQTVQIVSDTAGISIANLSVSDTFNAYEEKSIQLDITKSGDALIATSFQIKFVEDSTTYEISLEGLRYGQFFVSDPNWEDGIQVERKFLTSVFTGADMTESRRVLRSSPLRSMQATLFFHDKQAAGQMLASLREAASSSTAHPWYPDRALMTAANDTRMVYCPTEYRRFSSGDYAFLVDTVNPNTYNNSEVVRIDTVFTNGFSTVADIEGSYETGNSAYPAFVGHALLGGASASILTDGTAEVSMVVDEVYGPSQLGNEYASYTPTIKNELPVLEAEITFSELPEQTIVMAGEIASSGRGATQYTKGSTFITQQATAIMQSKEEIWDMEGFWNYIKGRGKPFWVIGEIDFLSIVDTSSNTDFIIDNSNPLDTWDDLRYVRITDSTGAFDILEVTNRQTVSEGTQITVETNSLADISKVRQAYAVRLMDDVISEEYLTDSVMLTTFTVQELQGI
jgi:hypothetical protein